jgi:hypothetical protein
MVSLNKSYPAVRIQEGLNDLIAPFSLCHWQLCILNCGFLAAFFSPEARRKDSFSKGKVCFSKFSPLRAAYFMIPSG